MALSVTTVYIFTTSAGQIGQSTRRSSYAQFARVVCYDRTRVVALSCNTRESRSPECKTIPAHCIST
ncbi:hypothetical protein J6590_048848 [Homalodisca vitripennis]|nr:hypothetical protein J6590_048848 [Homalodisca vitripennis]